MSSPRITVIIPTRERADVLEHALRTVLAQDHDNLAIIVSDNCSADNTREVVHALADERVRYINPGKRLSMSHHWEFALSHVEDGWVTIIGDDDGLLPDSIGKVAEIIAHTRARAIRSQTCTYFWPSFHNERYGRLRLKSASSREEMRDSRAWLQKALHGAADYRELPTLYTGGYVHISVVEEIRRRNGGIFYRSCIPDVYSGIAIASVLKDYLHLAYPLGIAGASGHSNGKAFIDAKRKGQDQPVSEKAKFLSEENISFHEAIPPETDGSPPINLQALVFESHFQSAPLHDTGVDTPTPEDMLEALVYRGLLMPGEFRLTRDWIERFARIYGLDMRAATRRALMRRLRTLFSPASLHDWLRRTTGAYGYRGNAQQPLATVHEASLFAQEMLRRNLDRKNYPRLLKAAPKDLSRTARAFAAVLATAK